MLLLPFKNITYQTALTEEEVYKNLTENIFHFSAFTTTTTPLLFSANHNQYMGFVDNKGFRLQKKGRYNKMTFLGTYQTKDGFLIKVSYQRWMATIFLLIVNIFLGSTLVESVKTGGFNPWLILGLLLVIFIANIISYRLFQYEIAIFEKFLEKTISATRVNKQDAS